MVYIFPGLNVPFRHVQDVFDKPETECIEYNYRHEHYLHGTVFVLNHSWKVRKNSLSNKQGLWPWHIPQTYTLIEFQVNCECFSLSNWISGWRAFCSLSMILGKPGHHWFHLKDEKWQHLLLQLHQEQHLKCNFFFFFKYTFLNMMLIVCLAFFPLTYKLQWTCLHLFTSRIFSDQRAIRS